MMALVAFVDEKSILKYQKLKNGHTDEVHVHTLISLAIEKLRQNPFCGIQVKKERIPKEYLKKFEIQNLWKFNLSDNWRMTYSVISDEENIVVVILEWFDHKEYERRFGYG